jgi:hypothetical protein
MGFYEHFEGILLGSGRRKYRFVMRNLLNIIRNFIKKLAKKLAIYIKTGDSL